MKDILKIHISGFGRDMYVMHEKETGNFVAFTPWTSTAFSTLSGAVLDILSIAKEKELIAN